MKDTKIIQVLRTFSPSEMKDFGYFVHSPFYNRVKNVTKLFEAIKKFHPDFDSRFLKKEYLYKKLTGKKTYNDAVMRNLCSDLYNCAKEFMSVKSLGQKQAYKNNRLIVEMKKRKLDNICMPELERLEQSISNYAYKDEQFHFDSLQFWNMRNDNFNHKNIEEFQQNFANEVSHLVHYFTIHLIDRYFQVNKFRTSYVTKEKHSFLKDVSKVLKNHGYMDLPIVEIYYYLLMLSVTEDEHYYYSLSEMLKSNFELLSKETKFKIYHCLSVFFSNNERSGIRKFRRDRFELFRDYTEGGVLIYNNLISPTSYMNAVESALLAGEFEWAEKFVNDFKKYLQNNQRQDAFYCSMAKILHAKGRNEEALACIAKAIPTGLTVKAVVKVIELRILFELELHDQIFHKLDSFRHFISKSEDMSPSLRGALDNFFRIYTMMAELRTGNKKYTAAGIKKELAKRNYCFSLEWLEEKLEGIK